MAGKTGSGKTDFAFRILSARKEMFVNPNFDRVMVFSGLRKNCLLEEDRAFFRRFKKLFERQKIPVDIDFGKPRF